MSVVYALDLSEGHNTGTLFIAGADGLTAPEELTALLSHFASQCAHPDGAHPAGGIHYTLHRVTLTTQGFECAPANPGLLQSVASYCPRALVGSL